MYGTWTGLPDKGADLENAPKMTLQILEGGKFQIDSERSKNIASGTWMSEGEQVTLAADRLGERKVDPKGYQQSTALVMNDEKTELRSSSQQLTWKKQ